MPHEENIVPFVFSVQDWLHKEKSAGQKVASPELILVRIVFVMFRLRSPRQPLHRKILPDVRRYPGGALSNSSQKRLPWPASDSTPTSPCIRSTDFLTNASPIPVPS